MIRNRKSTIRSAALLSGVGLLLLAGCDGPQRATGVPGGRVFAVDLAGKARKCEVEQPSPEENKRTATKMTVSNEGGWCGISVVRRAGVPYDSALMETRPTHGKVLVHRVGDTTRIDYTPTARFTGTDSFAVKLIPGNATLNVAVTVTGP
ncbi:MAG: hypothetical protein AB7O80_05360 [Acetobacteraceae bacterium]